MKEGQGKVMSKIKSMGIIEFINRFGKDDDCRQYLYGIKWPDGFLCPKCGHNDAYEMRTRQIYQCKACRFQTSLTSGTVMHKSHLPLTKWFLAIYLVSQDKRGYSSLRLKEEVSVTYKTAWYLLQRIRHAMANENAEELLAGLVEMDDSYFGGPKPGGKRGRGTSKLKVVAALSKNEKGHPVKLKMQVVPNLRSKTLLKFVNNSIAAGSVIQSDAYRSYRKLLNENYIHEYKKYDSKSDILSWLHTMLGNVKASIIGTFHGLNSKYMDAYLHEFCFKFNNRHSRNAIVSTLCSAIMKTQPISLAVLKG